MARSQTVEAPAQAAVLAEARAAAVKVAEVKARVAVRVRAVAVPEEDLVQALVVVRNLTLPNQLRRR